MNGYPKARVVPNRFGVNRRLILLVTVSILSLIGPLVFSFLNVQRTFVILSESMSPTLNSGDLILVAPIDGEIAKDSIIVFKSPLGGFGAHRMIDRVTLGEDTFYVTKGDANDHTDSFLIPDENVIGILSIVVPKIGLYFLIPRELALFTILILIASYIVLSSSHPSWLSIRGKQLRIPSFLKTPGELSSKYQGNKANRRVRIIEKESENINLVMSVEERAIYLKSLLAQLIRVGKYGSHLIVEDPRTEKFVQVVYFGHELLFDVPRIALSKEEERQIKLLLTEVHTYGPQADDVSYRKWMRANEIDEAIALIERIFIETFNLPESFAIMISLT